MISRAVFAELLLCIEKVTTYVNMMQKCLQYLNYVKKLYATQMEELGNKLDSYEAAYTFLAELTVI